MGTDRKGLQECWGANKPQRPSRLESAGGDGSDQQQVYNSVDNGEDQVDEGESDL